MAAMNRKLLYYLAFALLWLYDEGDEEEGDAYLEPVTVPWVAGINEMSSPRPPEEPAAPPIPFVQPVLLVVILLFVLTTAPIIINNGVQAHAAASSMQPR